MISRDEENESNYDKRERKDDESVRNKKGMKVMVLEDSRADAKQVGLK